MPTFGTTEVNLADATGRVLHQSVLAERDQPPFDRVTMDGIAIRFSSFDSGNRSFEIRGRQFAGDKQQTLSDEDGCIEIMTGAVLPGNADCVIPIERVAIADGIATLETDYAPTQHQFVHPRGSDHKAGIELLSPGQRIEAAHVAIIASSGLSTVNVSKTPVVRVISTGNELIAAGEPIETHQIRSSNGPAVVAMLETHGCDDCEHDHISDDKDVMAERIAKHLQEANVMILSGGVSMGKADFVPEVLAQLGVKVVFHKISQRPGKPMWFGIGPAGQAVFALPGNPVSTLVCCRQYVLPALSRASGSTASSTEYATLTEAYEFKPALTCFLPVRLSSTADGQLTAIPVATNTSGDFAALGDTDGYVELAKDPQHFAAGTAWPLHRWH